MLTVTISMKRGTLDQGSKTVKTDLLGPLGTQIDFQAKIKGIIQLSRPTGNSIPKVVVKSCSTIQLRLG